MVTNIYRVSIEWGDCDPAKIVFYPNYFVWFDEATRHLFASVGLDVGLLYECYGVVGMPIVEAKANFLLPSRFGDVIEVHSHVGTWRERSLTVLHRVMNGGQLAVDGFETRVWAAERAEDPKRLRTMPVPDEVRTRLGG